MNENLDPTKSGFGSDEFDLEKLRPLSFDDFWSRPGVRKPQSFFCCRQSRSEALDHTLFHGPPIR
jgi:Holliday junction DNA helicase RuvB